MAQRIAKLVKDQGLVDELCLVIDDLKKKEKAVNDLLDQYCKKDIVVGVPIRVAKLMHQLGITEVSDFRNYTRHSLLRYRNVGKGTIAEIKNLLFTGGLDFKK